MKSVRNVYRFLMPDALDFIRKIMPCRTCVALLLFVCPAGVFAQQSLTWAELRDKFEATNPTLRALQIAIDQSKAQEVTAYLRPNPDFTEATDGTQLTRYQGVWRPFAGTQFSSSVSYLHERQHKRELRRDSAQKATGIAVLSLEDQKRGLIFNLRSGFVNTLQAKAVLALAKENLVYYDKLLDVSRDRFKAGDIAQMDLDRLELARAQFESDLETSAVSLRTAKIQLLQLLNDRTPVAEFDVTGAFEFTEQILPNEEFRKVALDTRPDLKSAIQAIDKARTDHLLANANGTADPNFALWLTHNPSFNNPFAHDTIGASVSIPLRIFDKNQGEKLRTELEIGRSEKLLDANYAQVFSDVDSAYATLMSNLTLLQSYKAQHLQRAVRVRDTVSFSYQHGGASLLDFLNAQNDYRSIERNYLSLIGSYLTAAAQLNLAAGSEVIK
jgi:cobalt-zinc-cadmium efflux system outer membrane protein